MKVKDIMNKDVVSVKADTSVKQVAKTLYINHFSGVPVIDNDNVIIGIITEGDIVMQSSKIHLPQVIQILDSFLYPTGTADMEAELQKITAIKAEQLMTREVITISPDASIEDLATLITEEHVNPIPVVDSERKVLGIVSKSDLVWLLAKDVIRKKRKK
jgi:CBS domain-containing protein